MSYCTDLDVEIVDNVLIITDDLESENPIIVREKLKEKHSSHVWYDVIYDLIQCFNLCKKQRKNYTDYIVTLLESRGFVHESFNDYEERKEIVIKLW